MSQTQPITNTTMAAQPATVPNNIVSIAVPQQSYAAKVNAMYSSSASNIVSLDQRYKQTLATMGPNVQAMIVSMIAQSIAEFSRNNPHIKQWLDLKLAEAKEAALSDINIDTTMQRLLDLHWVAIILAKFKSTMVVPIQVYLDDSGRTCAWDGQHTAIMLWIICTQVLKMDPNDVKIPVNVYTSSKKSEIRENFVSLNGGEGKKMLDLIDIWQQQIFGVKIDGSKNPKWIETEKKQQILEKWDLFVTHDKFNNAHMPGAITRLQEINKYDTEVVDWLCNYLSTVMGTNRPADEKEVVMMAYFFGRCRYDRVKVDDAYIKSIAAATTMLWNADFSYNGPFWAKVGDAYKNWHDEQKRLGYIDPTVEAKVSKEPLHGMPFLIAQLAKSVPGINLPHHNSNSQFTPDAADLF